MQINLPFGRKIDMSLGKREKSRAIVRDNNGKVVGTEQTSFRVEKIDEYLECFTPSVYLQNFVFLYENVSEVYFPIHYITSRIKNANFVVKRYKDDSVVWGDNGGITDNIVGNSMKAMFERPNVMQSWKEFLEQVFVYLYLTGDAYIYAATTPLPSITGDLWKYCKQYWVLPSQNITVDTGYRIPLFSNCRMEELVKSYKLASPYGNMDVEPSLVLHLRDNASLDIGKEYFTGRSRLLSLKYPISNLCAVYEARNAIYVKRGALGALVNMKKDLDSYISMTPDEKKRIEDSVQERYGVTGNRNPLAVIDVPVQYLRFGMSIAELQPFEESLTDACAIAGAYGLDSVLVPRKDQSTYNNLSAAECKVYSSTIIPDVKMFCEALSKWLGLDKAGEGYYIDAIWDDVEVLQESKMKKEAALRTISERARDEFASGLITLNQWRAYENKERVMDEIYDKTLLQMDDMELEYVMKRIKLQ